MDPNNSYNRAQPSPNQPVNGGAPPQIPGQYQAGAGPQLTNPLDTGGYLPSPKVNSVKFKLMALAAGVELLIIIILIVVVAMSGGSHKSTNNNSANSNQNNTSAAETPATAYGLGQTNNAINQSLSSLHDDQDFPAGQLSNQNLGLGQ